MVTRPNNEGPTAKVFEGFAHWRVERSGLERGRSFLAASLIEYRISTALRYTTRVSNALSPKRTSRLSITS